MVLGPVDVSSSLLLNLETQRDAFLDSTFSIGLGHFFRLTALSVTYVE
jgi:hypothetical protein